MLSKTNKILCVITSHDKLGDTGEPTGLWLEELAAPYYIFRDAGYHVILASPAGGKPPVDPKSCQDDFVTEATRRFDADEAAQKSFENTAVLQAINAEGFDAIFYPGGHGPLWDLEADRHSIALIEAFWKQNKPVAAVCHGPIVLINVQEADGKYLVMGRSVTGFSNSEEAAVGLTDVVPLSVENMLKDHGGKFSKSDDFSPHVVQDGNLVTGQNPMSSVGVAETVLSLLKN